MDIYCCAWIQNIKEWLIYIKIQIQDILKGLKKCIHDKYGDVDITLNIKDDLYRGRNSI